MSLDQCFMYLQKNPDIMVSLSAPSIIPQELYANLTPPNNNLTILYDYFINGNQYDTYIIFKLLYTTNIYRELSYYIRSFKNLPPELDLYEYIDPEVKKLFLIRDIINYKPSKKLDIIYDNMIESYITSFLSQPIMLINKLYDKNVDVNKIINKYLSSTNDFISSYEINFAADMQESLNLLNATLLQMIEDDDTDGIVRVKLQIKHLEEEIGDNSSPASILGVIPSNEELKQFLKNKIPNYATLEYFYDNNMYDFRSLRYIEKYMMNKKEYMLEKNIYVNDKYLRILSHELNIYRRKLFDLRKLKYWFEFIKSPSANNLKLINDVIKNGIIYINDYDELERNAYNRRVQFEREDDINYHTHRVRKEHEDFDIAVTKRPYTLIDEDYSLEENTERDIDEEEDTERHEYKISRNKRDVSISHLYYKPQDGEKFTITEAKNKRVIKEIVDMMLAKKKDIMKKDRVYNDMPDFDSKIVFQYVKNVDEGYIHFPDQNTEEQELHNFHEKKIHPEIIHFFKYSKANKNVRNWIKVFSNLAAIKSDTSDSNKERAKLRKIINIVSNTEISDKPNPIVIDYTENLKKDDIFEDFITSLADLVISNAKTDAQIITQREENEISDNLLRMFGGSSSRDQQAINNIGRVEDANGVVNNVVSAITNVANKISSIFGFKQ